MTILELYKANPQRHCAMPPESIFAAKHTWRGEVLICFADLSFHPEEFFTPEWEVTKEHFTEEELAKWESEHTVR